MAAKPKPKETPATRRWYHIGLTVLTAIALGASSAPSGRYAIVGLMGGMAGLFFAFHAPPD